MREATRGRLALGLMEAISANYAQLFSPVLSLPLGGGQVRSMQWSFAGVFLLDPFSPYSTHVLHLYPPSSFISSPSSLLFHPSSALDPSPAAPPLVPQQPLSRLFPDPNFSKHHRTALTCTNSPCGARRTGEKQFVVVCCRTVIPVLSRHAILSHSFIKLTRRLPRNHVRCLVIS